MSRRLTIRRDNRSTKVGEHNGIDIYFSADTKRFSASWRLYRGRLWAKSLQKALTVCRERVVEVLYAIERSSSVERFRQPIARRDLEMIDEALAAAKLQ